MLERVTSRFRVWFGKVWKVRGGGLYAVGWAVTFVYLEVTTFFGEFAEADGIIDFLTGQIIEFFFRFLGQSFINMGLAFAWPVFIVQWSPPVGVIALGIAFAVFPIYVKPHITAWLFPDGEPDDDESETGGAQRK